MLAICKGLGEVLRLRELGKTLHKDEEKPKGTRVQKQKMSSCLSPQRQFHLDPQTEKGCVFLYRYGSEEQSMLLIKSCLF